jgi:choline-glycine betaine transporter
VSGSVLGWVTGNLGWLFVLLASTLVIFVIWLAAGKYGRIPLGGTTSGRSSAPSRGSR